ncbi:hypothetical protein D9M72_552280 [compost metagenome]
MLDAAGVELADHACFSSAALGARVHVVDGAARGAVRAGDDGAGAEHQALAHRVGATHGHITLPVLGEVELGAGQDAAVVVLAMGAAEHVDVAPGRVQQVAHAGQLRRLPEEAVHPGAAVVDLVDAVVHVQ